MVAVAITLSEDKYFEKYASWLREIDIEPVRITNPDSLSDISEGNFDIKLHRKHSGDDGDTEHEVDLVDSNFNVTSHHHLAIRKLGTNLSAIGHSEDGIIEAVKHTKFPWFAVQWHPERTSEGMGRSIPKEWLLQQIRNISNIQDPDSVA